MTPAAIAALVQAARRRASCCPIHERKLDPNGRVCIDCLIVSRRSVPALTMLPFNRIMAGQERRP